VISVPQLVNQLLNFIVSVAAESFGSTIGTEDACDCVVCNNGRRHWSLGANSYDENVVWQSEDVKEEVRDTFVFHSSSSQSLAQ